PFHLSQIELQKMADSGRWEMGSHTQNGHGTIPIDAAGDQGHFLSNLMWISDQHRLETVDEYKERVTADLTGARNDIETKLGVASPSFAYPYGDLGQGSSNFPQGQVILTEIVKSIYSAAFIQVGNNDFITNTADDSFLSKRIGIDSSVLPGQLVTMLDNARFKPLDYADNFTSDKGWLRGWGGLTIDGGQMLISTTQEDDSASTFLSGSSLWKNYIFSARINVLKGDSFELVAYKDENNYATCDFSGDWAALTQAAGGGSGHDQEIATTTLKNAIAPGAVLDAALKVEGNTATCYLNGNQIFSGNISGTLDRRGIGFKTWDSLGTGSEFSVTNLKVSQVF
ncbi:MAG: polysaccharide deacetylase family protein, partial [Candidatus Pacebacteria bacterium]|nr:polysaccharide deacetylase family protein [Candidatus Paceibacterota bacterium]